MAMNFIFENLIVIGIPLLFAITLHEAAHGYVARFLGDSTAEKMGRITLNPIAHVDLIGTILIPFFILFFSSGAFLFGYAKPVPVNPLYFKNPRRDMAYVAIAGPFSNFLMALFWTFILKLSFSNGASDAASFLGQMASAGILVNLVLIALNLIPIPPLDGGRIAVGFLPLRAAAVLNKMEPYGLVIILILLFTDLLSKIINPFIALLTRLLSVIFSVYS